MAADKMADRSKNVLHSLAQDGDIKLLQQALKTNPVNVADADGMLPLHYASWYGHPSCCQALLAANAEVDAFDHDGASALHAAAYNGQLACVVLLIENGASTLVSDNDNQSPLDAAAAESHIEIVNYLRIVEEDERREAAFVRARDEFARAQEAAKVFKPEVVKATKEAKKLVDVALKNAKRIQKETISKLKKERGKKTRGSVSSGSAGGPETFSQLAGGDTPSRLGSISSDGGRRSGLKSKRSSNNSNPGTPSTNSRPLPDVPKVSPEVAEEMVLAQFEADGDETDALIAFLKSIDLKEFSRLLTKNKMTLQKLQKASSEELTKLGLPAGARKKVYAALHPGK